ncbi:hydroxymethylglutaryl-CoA reductase [Gardnerella vaginalis 55152]|uniref:3-hydroxy-3-methylglutaryl coenzyme A reductase n=1 Tax=Gardnerella vaginalis 55152 TaxID=698955 RepID=I4LUI7_GARVA|nr:hydroxymethylglutaryl-CoA reductase, degradative [Gardnerella vaginalis]EIK80627.1 hydroxymethylglutaryl-CoA reductase [Gardnerella vaginalis 55152]
MSAFRELNVEQRIKTLESEGALSEDCAQLLLEQLAQSSETNIPASVANSMIENQIGRFSLPVGVVRGLKVNGVTRNVLMATEEPSVIAAACNGAKIAAKSLENGVVAHSAHYVTSTQIVFEDKDGSVAKKLDEIMRDESRRTTISEVARSAHPSIYQRGGGLERAQAATLNGFAKLTLDINACDAMGANIANTIGEAVKTQLESWVGRKALVAILANSSRAATIAEIHLPVEALVPSAKTAVAGDADGMRLARRIAALSSLATVDAERAATHNKGILNGIVAAALASGNDTRALQAAAHEWATKSGRYMPLSTWTLQNSGQILYGRIEIPLQIGTVGGAISSLPMSKVALQVAEVENANDFRNILAAVGLVQNLAALRALAGPGIQAGHMRLQAANIAIASGAHGNEIQKVVHALLNEKRSDLNTNSARMILDNLRKDKNT